MTDSQYFTNSNTFQVVSLAPDCQLGRQQGEEVEEEVSAELGAVSA